MQIGVTVTRTYKFSAAHSLPFVPDGHKCKNMHGHNYRLDVTFTNISAPDFPIGPYVDVKGLRGDGMAIDFFDLDKLVEPLIKIVDHTTLNSIEGLGNPTAELIAAWFVQKLVGTGVVAVRCWEEDDCSALATLLL